MWLVCQWKGLSITASRNSDWPKNETYERKVIYVS